MPRRPSQLPLRASQLLVRPSQLPQIHGVLFFSPRQASRTRSFALKNVMWERDPVTGLRRLRTEFGRPRWEKEMATVEKQHPGAAVGED